MSVEVFIKEGNVTRTNPHKRCLDKMVIDYTIDELHPDNGSYEKFLSILLPDRVLPFIKEAVKPTKDRVRSKFLDAPYMLSKLDGYRELFTAVRTPGLNVQPVDLRHITDMDKLFKSTSLIDPSIHIEDPCLVTAGLYTIGPGGGDAYARRALADVDTGTQTDKLEFKVNSDNISETAWVNWTHNGAGFEFKLSNAEPHSGSPLGGFKTLIAHGSNGIHARPTGGGTVEWCDDYIKRTVAGSTTNQIIGVGMAGLTTNLHDLIIDGNNLDTEAIDTITSGTIEKVWNFMIRSCNGSGIVGLSSTEIENGFILDIGNRGVDVVNKAENVYCTGSASKDFNNVTEGNNCASGDATTDDFTSGSNNLKNLTASAEIVTNFASAYFGLPLVGGVIKDLGKVPRFAVNDMTKALAYTLGNYPIAGKILLAGDTTSIIPILMNAHRRRRTI